MRRDSETRSKIGGWPLAAGIAVVLVFLFFVRHILLPFILAAAAAFLLTPVVERLERRARLPRWAAAVAVYAVVLLALGLLFRLVGGSLVRDVTQLAQNAPESLRRLLGELGSLTPSVIGHKIDTEALTNEVFAELKTLAGGGAVISFAGYGVAAIVGVVLFVVLLIYFLISGHTIAEGAFWLVPPEYRREVRSVARNVLPVLWRYFLGLAVVVTYTVTVAWLGFGVVFHLPRAPLLAVAVGLFELVPVIGPAASIAIVSLTALQQSGLLAILSLVGFAVGLRLSIDQLIGPLVLGQATRLHPVVIIFCFLSGAVLFGVIGLLLAVPVAASIKIILTAYYGEPVVEDRVPRRPPEVRP